MLAFLKYWRHKLSISGEESLKGTAIRVLGVIWYYPAHRRWLKVIKHPATRRILDVYPKFSFKYTSAYLSRNISRERRLMMLESHYAFINERLGKQFFDAALDGTLMVWSATLQGNQFGITLTGPCLATLHREGDLSLNFQMNGRILSKLAFSIVSTQSLANGHKDIHAQSAYFLFVGQVQGVPVVFQDIKFATKICMDVAPADLLMWALAGLASAIDVEHIAGVSTELHICTKKFSGDDKGFNYDAFWERYGAVWDNEEGSYRLQLPYPMKPLQLLPSNHRGRNREKRAFKKALADQVEAAFRSRIWAQ